MKIFNSKFPIKIYSLYLNAPQEYRNKLVETTYRLKSNIKSEELSFKKVFNESSKTKVVATSYKAWQDNPIYNTLCNNILKTIENKILKPTIDHPLPYIMASAWAGIYDKDQYANEHNHSPLFYSFCYYIEAKPPYTPMVFKECDLTIDAKTDLLIVFPSYINHSVPPVTGSKRIFMAGNIVPTYEI